MQEEQYAVLHAYRGWDVYQQQLLKVIAPLTHEQLALRAAPHLRSIEELTTHLIAVRVRWFHMLLLEGSDEIAPLGRLDHPNEPVRTANELITGLEMSWQLVWSALARWKFSNLDDIFRDEYQGKEYALSRQWVLWHVIEHDLHHGGELSLTLGIHGLNALDI